MCVNSTRTGSSGSAYGVVGPVSWVLLYGFENPFTDDVDGFVHSGIEQDNSDLPRENGFI